MGRSTHLFDPLISTPNIGTKARIKIEIKNRKGKYFISLPFSCNEIAKIKNNEMETNIRCLIKKKYVCLFILSDITEVVDEKEKKSPSNKSNANKNKICLLKN